MSDEPFLGIDLDGTILDCRPRQEAVLLSIMPQARPYTDQIWNAKRSGQSTTGALRAIGLTPPPDFHEIWMARIEAVEFLNHDTLLPGAGAALETLSHDMALHLVTSRQKAAGVFSTLRRLGLHDLFQEITVVRAGKEAAAEKAEALSRFDTIAHCGDTEVDGLAAQIAGLPFLAVTCGQRSDAFLADHTFARDMRPTLNDLVTPILGLTARHARP